MQEIHGKTNGEVNYHGKYHGKFPVSNGYVFTAPSITKDNIYFHLEKNNHTQRIYITFGKTNWSDNGKWTIERYEDTHFVNEVTVLFTTLKFTISDAKKLIKDLPKDDVIAYNQAFKILYPNL